MGLDITSRQLWKPSKAAYVFCRRSLDIKERS